MITLKELASRCNVSIATVSNILNGKSNVGEETKKRVLEVVKETGYKPNIMARGLRANKTKTIPDKISNSKYLGLIFCLQYLHFPPMNI